MGDGNDHEEFLHLLGDARFSTLRQRCLALEKLKKHGGLQIPWTEKSVRSLLSNLHKEECTPNYIQQAWDTLKWFSTKFQTLDVTATHRLAAKKKWLQETLVSTASTPQRKAVVPAKEVILALEQGAAAGGADPHEAIDAFILGMVRFQVGSSARFNDLQHTSPSTMKVTSNTIEMMAWQTKTASAFRIKKNPVPLIAPKLSLSGVDWWTEWSKTLTLLSSLERFQNMDYLIPTLSKDFQGVIPRPSTSDRGLRWLKEALVRQGVDQDLVTPLTWHSFRVFIPDCAYQLGIPRAQRQYLGNWQTESTADIYTREKRNVVVDIWSKVLGKIQEVDLQPGRMVRDARRVFGEFTKIRSAVVRHWDYASEARARLANKGKRKIQLEVGDKVMYRDPRSRSGGRTPWKKELTGPWQVISLEGNRLVLRLVAPTPSSSGDSKRGARSR